MTTRKELRERIRDYYNKATNNSVRTMSGPVYSGAVGPQEEVLEVLGVAKDCIESKCEGWKDACDQNDKLGVALAKLEEARKALRSLHRMATTKPAWCGSGTILSITTVALSEEEQKKALER